MINLDASITFVSGVGQAYQNKLRKLGIRTIKDLIFHYPTRYLDYSKFIKISELRANRLAVVKGDIIVIENHPAKTRRMMITEAIIQDETGTLKIVWFNQPYLKQALIGKSVMLAGQIAPRQGEIVMNSPEYEVRAKGQLHIGRIVPIYPETKGVSSKWLRAKIDYILKQINQIEDYLPKNIREKYQLIDILSAIKQIHFPKNDQDIQQAQQRIAFNELFIIALQSQLDRTKIAKKVAPKIEFFKKQSQEIIKSLPFELTTAQKKSSRQIIQDLTKDQPMNRLLNGDVGSGKTIVAAIAGLNIVLSGFQVVYMVPTEVLAKQHFQTFTQLFKDLDLKVGLYTAAKKTFEMTDKKQPDIIIGTQALIQKGVNFTKLGLVIIDEQHRFGVDQRAQLIKKSKLSKMPHFLTMTATPIPRTLTLALYGDLDVSILDELPKKRKPVITRAVRPRGRKKAYQFIRQQIRNNRQVFVICPLIEQKKDLRSLDQKSVEQEYQKLNSKIFPDLKISYLHGKMKSAQKEQIMADFKAKKSDILVSTSVIEVGIDIPNVSLIMIEGAERFGLSQLHQFRGRVGRSSHQSYCLLFPAIWSEKINKRLAVIINSNDGFKIAKQDLKLRGPGEIYGLKQHGLISLKMASLFDIILVKRTRQAAKQILDKDPELLKSPDLKQALTQYQTKVHLE